jgi:hypothetical protein
VSDFKAAAAIPLALRDGLSVEADEIFVLGN